MKLVNCVKTIKLVNCVTTYRRVHHGAPEAASCEHEGAVGAPVEEKFDLKANRGILASHKTPSNQITSNKQLNTRINKLLLGYKLLPYAWLA